MTMQTILSMLGQGMITSFWIFLWTLVGSLPLGMLITFGRRSRFKPISLIFQFYISVMRGTPLMLQLFVIYFGPYYIFGIQISDTYRFTATLIAFILNYAAYFAEIYRSGIDSMPAGQYEAANVLGYSHTQTFMKIILPQVVKRILPAVTNEVITLVKDTSLAFAIGVTEMFTTAKAIAASQRTMTAFIIAAVFYYVFNLLVAFIMDRIEKRMAYYHE
jgi:polar amino acid transport system permease protein